MGDAERDVEHVRRKDWTRAPRTSTVDACENRDMGDTTEYMYDVTGGGGI